MIRFFLEYFPPLVFKETFIVFDLFLGPIMNSIEYNHKSCLLFSGSFALISTA